MNDLQLPLTLVASTGTGLLYTAFEQGSDIAVWKNGSGATRSTLSLKRTQAKPVPTFPGVTRVEFKRTNYVTVGANERTLVITCTASIPADVPEADASSAWEQAMFAFRDNVWKDAIKKGVIPT